jgi:hypothetical protein
VPAVARNLSGALPAPGERFEDTPFLDRRSIQLSTEGFIGQGVALNLSLTSSAGISTSVLVNMTWRQNLERLPR